MTLYARDNPAAADILAAAAQLDARLDSFAVTTPGGLAALEARIMANVPRTLGDRLLDWLLPPGAFLRPGFAAASLLAVGMVIGTLSLDTTTDTGSWDSELYLLALDISSVIDASEANQ